MKKRKKWIGVISVAFLLLVGSIVYSLLRDEDPYRYFTGMGDSFDLSPNDEYILFSYYINGKESIYRSKIDGTEVEKLTESETENYHSPSFSNDEMKFLFLAKNDKGINKLYLTDQNDNVQKILTPNDMHVSEAVFSMTGEEIYFIGTPAEDFKKAEGETTEGFDLFVVNLATEKIEQLTNQDYFTMNYLSVSQDGKELYYSLFDGREMVTAYSLEDGVEKEAPGSNLLPKDTYSFRYSPDGSKFAYTTVSDESLDSSLFKYELFLLDLETEQTKRLTNLNSSVVSPKFFTDQTKIAFLENTNWPQDPAEHTLQVINLANEKIHSVEFDLDLQQSGHWLVKIIDMFANGKTVAILYIVLMGLFSTYLALYYTKRKSYVPAIASLILTGIVFTISFVVTVLGNPWFGIGLGMLSGAIIACTIVIFVYTSILNYFLNRKSTNRN